MADIWKTFAKEKKARLDEAIPPEWRIESKPESLSVMGFPQKTRIMTDAEMQITESNASELVKKLASGDLTSTAVTTAFCKRAAIAQQLVNCNHEFFPKAALEQAKALDEYFAEHKKPIGPLHGLPISLKDQFRVKGFETTMGYVAWVGKYETEDSVIVDLLRKAGAVFYVKTSVSQSLMIAETLNNIIGRTVNPRNSTLSCGGSSGGEGALLALRGSPLGVGTDIGGSVRIPGAFNNLFGLRPSHGRLPYGNMANSTAGQETVPSVCGPISHSMEDIKLFVTSILDKEPWEYDSKVIPMPWRQAEEDAITAKMAKEGLTLAYYDCDNKVQVHPPIMRGVKTVVDAAQKAGHNLVHFEPYDHAHGLRLFARILTADSGADIMDTLKQSGEPNIPNIKNLLTPDVPKQDINDVWNTNLERWQYQMDYLAAIKAAEARVGKKFDAIIAPIAATAAVRHDQYKYYGYSSIVNLLDFTSVAVPVTFADKDIDVAHAKFTSLSDLDQEIQDEYDAEAYHGAPVGVQVIGRRLTEEKTMAIAKEIGRILHASTN